MLLSLCIYNCNIFIVHNTLEITYLIPLSINSIAGFGRNLLSTFLTSTFGAAAWVITPPMAETTGSTTRCRDWLQKVALQMSYVTVCFINQNQIHPMSLNWLATYWIFSDALLPSVYSFWQFGLYTNQSFFLCVKIYIQS